MPLVSVILTAHNYGCFLAQSIESVLAQTFEDWELIVVDDGSTDHTAEVLSRYAGDPRITVLSLQGIGLAAACNRGARASHGKLLLRLDADDFLDPHALKIQVDLLARRPDVGLAYPDFHLADGDGNYLGSRRPVCIKEGARLLDVTPLAGGALYRRSCYDVLGGYDEALRYQEDYDFWVRFTERFRAHGVGLPLLSYRQHAGSMSKNRINRSAARRYVKRQYMSTRRLGMGREVLIVIPEIWPGAPDRPRQLLHRSLGLTTPLQLALEQAQACEGPIEVVVVTDHSEARQAAEVAGVEAMMGPVSAPTNFERSELAWLRVLVQTWPTHRRTMPDLLILASPYCPLRHPERLREAIDTLLIHECDLVVSVDSESVTPLGVGPASLQTEQSIGLPEEIHIVREAGELLAVRTGWLAEPRPLAESLVGHVELLHPEWWCLTDEEAWQAYLDLVPEAEALKSPASAYLRAEK